MMAIGDKLKSVRAHSGLSLRVLGERTGFSASFLSQVELGQASPSIASLQKITEALGMTLAQFLTMGEASTVLRRSQREAVRSEWSRATAEALVPASADERLTAMLIKLDRDGKTGASLQLSGRRMFAYVTAGAPRLILGEPTEELDLEVGDSLVVDGPRYVAWENHGEVVAEVVVVTTRTV